MSDLSIRLGIYGIPAQGFAFIIVWVFYWIYRYIDHRKKFPNAKFFNKKTSLYYEEFFDENAEASENSLDAVEIESDVENSSPNKLNNNPASDA